VTLSALCAGLTLGGCTALTARSSQASVAAPAQFARIALGSSQRVDVTAMAGEPDYVVPRYNVAVYATDEHPGAIGVGCGKDYRFVCGVNRKTAYNMYFIQYNDKDVVERTEIHHGDMKYSDIVAWARNASSH
jgi:hypothetical protein